jgi:hypothetical protein
MAKVLFSELGIAGAGFLLIFVGILFIEVEDMGAWGTFCITLGISTIASILALKATGVLQLVIGIIGLGSFVLPQ